MPASNQANNYRDPEGGAYVTLTQWLRPPFTYLLLYPITKPLQYHPFPHSSADSDG